MEATETPQVEQLTAEALQKVLQWVESAEGFVVEQAPLVAQEVIARAYVTLGLKFAICVFALLLLVMAAAYFIYLAKREHEPPYAAVGIIGGIILGVFPFIEGASAVMQLASVYFAPRLYVIEQLSNLAK